MLKVEDVRGITDYCRVLGHNARDAARMFQRSRNTVAKVLKDGVEGFRGTEMRWPWRSLKLSHLCSSKLSHRSCA